MNVGQSNEGRNVAYAMKRVAARRSSPEWLFESTKRRDDIKPTTGWAAVFSSSTSTRYLFLPFSKLGSAVWEISGEGSAQSALPMN